MILFVISVIILSALILYIYSKVLMLIMWQIKLEKADKQREKRMEDG